MPLRACRSCVVAVKQLWDRSLLARGPTDLPPAVLAASAFGQPQVNQELRIIAVDSVLDEIIGLREASELSGLSYGQLKRAHDRGELFAQIIGDGRVWLTTKTAIEMYMDDRQEKARAHTWSVLAGADYSA